MHFSLAHLSDVHIGPLSPAWAFEHFKPKRLVGMMSWYWRRRHIHSPEIAAAIVKSIQAAKPDHIAFTGDLINIAAWPEFTRGRTWLEALGAPNQLTFVPGNHDAYVKVPFEHGLGQLEPWAVGDGAKQGGPQFPFVRLYRNVALIGLSTAVPQALHMAGGTLGPQQLRDLPHLLENLDERGFFRIVLIHHPPFPGLAAARKALTDAAALQDILKAKGAELVLHGHNHHSMENWLATNTGHVPAIGVASASAIPSPHTEAAGWNMYRIRRQHGRWQTEIVRHHWDADSQAFVPAPPALLSPP